MNNNQSKKEYESTHDDLFRNKMTSLSLVNISVLSKITKRISKHLSCKINSLQKLNAVRSLYLNCIVSVNRKEWLLEILGHAVRFLTQTTQTID